MIFSENRFPLSGSCSRSNWTLAHEGLAPAFGDELVVLIERAVEEFDDAGIGPRFRFALVEDLGRAMHRVTLKQRVRKLYVLHSEISDRCADGGVVDRNP